jgi:PAS domain S-box-containing protein
MAATQPSSPGRVQPEAQDPTQPPVVLVVDDNATKRLALTAILAPLGLRIVEADSGVAALRCVMAENFAVILLDVRMPGMDGFETAALMRQRRESELTPIIFITAYDSDDIATRDRYVGGAVDFMFAPVMPNELRAKVSVFANLYSRAELLASDARDVQTSADQLRLLTDAAPIGIFQTDAQNRFVYTNPRWTSITGIPAEAAGGQTWEALVALGGGACLATEPDGETDVADSRRFEIRPPGAPPRVVVVTSNLVPDGDGATAGWVGTLADVTAEAGAEAAMAHAHEAALAANVMQLNFAASASHELRTPTTSILGYVEEVLENDALAKDDRGFLEIVYRNARRLSQLIDDLLVVGQGEIGASLMHLELAPLEPLVERVLSTFVPKAQGAGIALLADHGTDAVSVLVDPPRFEQVLTNLVSNALGFTPSGGTVTITTRRRGAVVEVAVCDTGMGIEVADIAQVFGRFYRATNATEAAVKGTGLGLAIAKGMIEAQNGRIRVASTVGVGSTFTVSLPIPAHEALVA